MGFLRFLSPAAFLTSAARCTQPVKLQFLSRHPAGSWILVPGLQNTPTIVLRLISALLILITVINKAHITILAQGCQDIFLFISASGKLVRTHSYLRTGEACEVLSGCSGRNSTRTNASAMTTEPSRNVLLIACRYAPMTISFCAAGICSIC
jgi:hypothetical protein